VDVAVGVEVGCAVAVAVSVAAGGVLLGFTVTVGVDVLAFVYVMTSLGR
jgi:hypothetical protein